MSLTRDAGTAGAGGHSTTAGACGTAQALNIAAHASELRVKRIDLSLLLVDRVGEILRIGCLPFREFGLVLLSRGRVAGFKARDVCSAQGVRKGVSGAEDDHGRSEVEPLGHL